MKVSQNLKVTWQNVPSRTITAGGVEFGYRRRSEQAHQRVGRPSRFLPSAGR
jgi:hypothetical protein